MKTIISFLIVFAVSSIALADEAPKRGKLPKGHKLVENYVDSHTGEIIQAIDADGDGSVDYEVSSDEGSPYFDDVAAAGRCNSTLF